MKQSRLHILAILAVGAVIGYAAANPKFNPLQWASASPAIEPAPRIESPTGGCCVEADRAAIEKLYDKVFAGMKGAKLTITVSSARMVGADTAIEDGFTEVTPADGGPGTAARFSAVLVKKGGEWFFESVRESVAHPPSNSAHFDEIDWLIGDWVGGAEKGKSGTATYSWAENQNFIVSSFATTLNGIPVVGGTQWIGWDAVDKQIRSWSFYSGGGFGEAVWTKDGGKWVTKVVARTAEGKKVAGTNTLTKKDADHITWQMSNLTVDGQQVPDPAPLKLKRAKP